MSEFSKRTAINKLQDEAAALIYGMTVASARLAAIPVGAKFTPTAGAGGSNICNVAINLQDALGVDMTGVRHFTVYLSDAATGLGLTATAASGTVQAKSASGTDVAVLTAKKAIAVQSLASGIYTLEITATAKTLYYICVVNPSTGAPIVSAPLITANYG